MPGHRPARWLASAALLLALPACDTATGPPDPPPAASTVAFGAPITWGQSIEGLTVGDVDGDGQPDVIGVSAVASGRSGGTVYVLLSGRPGGPALVTTEYTERPTSWWSVAAGDLDGDGDLDLVAASGGSDGELYVLHGDGTGAFAVVQRVGSIETGVTTGTGDVAVADLDGDGTPEVVASKGFGGLILFDVEADGRIGDVAVVTPGGRSGEYPARPIAVGDLDGDGTADVAHATVGGVEVLRRIRATLRVGARSTEALPGDVWAVSAGDADGDGDLDLAAFGRFGAPGGLLENTRPGFRAAPLPTAETARVVDARIGDLDGDGDGDLVLIEQAGDTYLTTAEVALNTAGPGATPVFVRLDPADVFAAWDRERDRPTGDLALADLDADGTPDLIGIRGRALFVAYGQPAP